MHQTSLSALLLLIHISEGFALMSVGIWRHTKPPISHASRTKELCLFPYYPWRLVVELTGISLQFCESPRKRLSFELLASGIGYRRNWSRLGKSGSIFGATVAVTADRGMLSEAILGAGGPWKSCRLRESILLSKAAIFERLQGSVIACVHFFLITAGRNVRRSAAGFLNREWTLLLRAYSGSELCSNREGEGRKRWERCEFASNEPWKSNRAWFGRSGIQ